jgi:hypothetical protein
MAGVALALPAAGFLGEPGVGPFTVCAVAVMRIKVLNRTAQLNPRKVFSSFRIMKNSTRLL